MAPPFPAVVRARRVVPVPLLLLLAFATLAPLVQLAEPAFAYVPHGPIYLDGDDAFCGARAHGVVNCATADGTPEHPYVISGWSITVADEAACDSVGKVPSLGESLDCTPLAACAGGAPGALAVCATNATVVVRDVRIEVTHRQSTAAVVVANAPGVRIEQSVLVAAGSALHVEASTGGPHGVIVAASSLSVADAQAPAAQPLVAVAGGSLTVEDSAIAANGRMTAVDIEGRAGHGDLLSVANSSVSGALKRGVDAHDVAAMIRGSSFVDIGFDGWGASLRDPSDGASLYVDGSSGLYLDVGENPLSFDHNILQVRGVGLNVVGNGVARVEWNRFVPGEGSPPLRPVALRFADEACAARAWYNELAPGMRVVHGSDGGDCSLDARHTWWGQATGPNISGLLPQVDGHVLYEPWLRAPPHQLPRVNWATPDAGSRHAGQVVLEGSVEGAGPDPVERVQAVVGSNWSQAVLADGTESWRVDLDLDPYPYGELSVQVRACGPLECGPPVARSLVHAAPPAPPVAVLKAYPRVTQVDVPVLIDGSSSYATDTFPLVAYRFNYGDGRSSDWQDDATQEVVYTLAGRYTVALEVRDETGTASMNRALVLLHVREAAPAGVDEVGQLPALSLSAVLAILAFVVAFQGVRRWR